MLNRIKYLLAKPGPYEWPAKVKASCATRVKITSNTDYLSEQITYCLKVRAYAPPAWSAHLLCWSRFTQRYVRTFVRRTLVTVIYVSCELEGDANDKLQIIELTLQKFVEYAKLSFDKELISKHAVNPVAWEQLIDTECLLA